MKTKYLERAVDAELQRRLQRIGAVLIEGVKGCGKTATASQHCASEVRLDTDVAARDAASVSPRLVLNGLTPRLIDEWQLAPGIWNAVRREVDARQESGQFILAGSATPADDITRHSGAGRISRLRMRTLSLFESGLSSGQVSLGALLEGGNEVGGKSPLSLEDLIEETCHGGWPADRSRPLAQAQENVADYVSEIAITDIKEVEGVQRDPGRVQLLMQALARNTATEARLTTLAKDTEAFTDDTAGAYLRSLERIMVVEPLTSWSPILRDKARIRTTAKHHFVDPAVSAALLNAGPDELRRDLKTFGFLFESLVVRDLRIYSEVLRARVHHFRDSSNCEVDIIVDGGYNRWGAIEVKLASAGSVINEAATKLLDFVERVDPQSAGIPAFLAIVTADGYAYIRPDGVNVIPLATLCP